MPEDASDVEAVAPTIPEDAEEVCGLFCGRLYDCMADICPFEVVGDRPWYTERCEADCVTRPLEIAAARELGFAACEDITARECRLIPDLRDFCDCARAAPVDDEGRVCGAPDIVDVAWCTARHCDPPEMWTQWYRLGSDGRFLHGFRAPSGELACREGEWTVVCRALGATTHTLWLRTETGLDVMVLSIGEGTIQIGPTALTPSPGQSVPGCW